MQAWDDFLNAQEKRIGKATVDQWLRSLKVVHFDSGNLYLEAKDAFHIHWFEEQMRPHLASQLINNNHRPIKVHISLKDSQYETKKESLEKRQRRLVFLPDNLDPAVTLENFIPSDDFLVGYRLLFELVERTPAAPNPIFLWGGAGTGKTHLLMALTKTFKRQGLNALYCRIETFTQHVVAAIRSSQMPLFRKHYRAADILLIDDTHQLARKDATQEEFFHTFNVLHTAGKPLLLAAQLPPALLTEIEPRLISRFEWGITLHLGHLNKENLRLLLERRSTALQLSLSKEVQEWLVETFPSCYTLNRALDALILRLHLEPSHPINPSSVKSLLQDLMENQATQKLTPEKILSAVATYSGIHLKDILSKAQTHECLLPRQLAMYLCRKELKISYPSLGRLFSRDHSTVMASVKQIEQKVKNKEPAILTALLTIQQTLNLCFHRDIQEL